MNPAPYPLTNTPELEAIVTLLGLLDLKYEKPDAKWLDKKPNTDGQIEIVDEKQKPLGKIEVQIRKFPDGDTTYQCPIELVAYSERISLPFILICVDVGNKIAYFRHLHRMMPELKLDQQSFVIKFDQKVHSISPETQYRHQWLEIIQDYNKRIADCPLLRQIAGQLNPSHISKEDRIFFQEFIENVNRFLDSDFSIVKELFFKGVWKLGVGVSSADSKQICFQLYVILPGDPAILVSGIPTPPDKPAFVPDDPNVISWYQGGRDGKTVQYSWKIRSALKSAKNEAQDFVLDYLKKLLREKAMPLYGKRLAVEYLFWFVDHFGQSCGVEEANQLNVGRLNYGISIYLPAWYSLALPRYLNELATLNNGDLSQFAFPPFEAVACMWPKELRPTENEVAIRLTSGPMIPATPVRFTEVSWRSLMDAVNFLIGTNEEHIERPYKVRTSQPKWIWSGYSLEDLQYNVEKILLNSINDYRQFLEHSRIHIKKSLFFTGKPRSSVA